MTEVPAGRPQGYPIAPWDGQEPQPLYLEGQFSGVENDEPLLRRYWRMLYRRRWVVLSIVAAFIGLAIIASMLTQRMYTATTRIQVDREATKVLNIEGIDAEDSVAVNAEFYQTQYALLKSRSLSEAVVRSLGLADNYRYLANYDPGAVDAVRELSRDERFALATTKVNESTTVAPVRLSSVVDIEVESARPQVAATIANEVAEKYIETNLSRRFEATAYARQFLQNQLNSVRTRLERSERQATEYARAQGLINIDPGTDGGTGSEQPLINAELAQLSSQLALARAERERAQADFGADSGGSAAERSLSNVAVNQLRQQRGELMGELRKLQSDFGPDYPKVKALQAQLAELDQQISREETTVRSGVRRDLYDRYRQALATEQGLQQRVDQLKSAVLDQQQRAIRFNIIQRDVDTNRALYDALLQRFKEIGVAGGVGANNVSIVDPALPPDSPSSPNVPLNLALGLIIGLGAGAGAAFALEHLAESVVLPADFQQKLGVPLLGSTPNTTGEAKQKLIENKSELAEAYFSVLTAVQFSTASGAPRTIAVTSSQAAEGKSTTALALARDLVSLGRRVLIIDADMRNPSLHRSLGCAGGSGLSDVLAGHSDFGSVVRETETSGLFALTAGVIPPNPAELLAGSSFERVLTEAAETFDHIVVDSPPVLGLADAPLIARATEGTVFVVESGRTRAGQARQALDRLFAVRAHLIGAVLTKLDSKNAGYGSGYGYDYSYGNS